MTSDLQVMVPLGGHVMAYKYLLYVYKWSFLEER